MQQLLLSGISCYAYHGCLPQETQIGGRYMVDITFFADLSQAMQSDSLEHTIDYVEVNELVKTQMAVASKLIEHVAHRMLTALKERFPQCQKIKVAITKFNPPVHGFMDKAVFIVEG
jgi:dihydroneopterin aldolase